MTLSVVIPAHNSADTIESCLRSIASQMVPDIEIVVVDDGSSDDLLGVVRSFDPSGVITVLRQDQSGVSVARNLGFAASRGDRVIFIDADDCLPPDSLGAFLGFSVASAADISVGDFLIRSDRGDVRHANINSRQPSFDSASAAVFQWLCIARVGFHHKPNTGLLGGPWAKIYKRDFLERAFPDGQLFTPGIRRGQDVLFNVEAFGAAQSVSYRAEPVYIYRTSDSSHSRRQNDEYVSSVAKLVQAMNDLIRRKNWPHLEPAVAALSVTLFEEAVLRLGADATASTVRTIASQQPFIAGIPRARLRDFSRRGASKLLLLKIRSFGLYAKTLRSISKVRPSHARPTAKPAEKILGRSG